MGEINLLSLVIPVLNEEANIDELISRCISSCRNIGLPFEIIMVDDGSVDGSWTKISQASIEHPKRIVGVRLNRNYGQHSAIMAGFEESKGDVIVTLDADLQNPPEEVPKLISSIKQGFDVVGSVRENRQDSLFRRTASFLTNKIIRHYTGVMMTDYGCMLRAYRRHIVDAVLACREHSTFIPVLANCFTENAREVEVQHAERNNGHSNYGLLKLINLLFDLLTSMSTLPLRMLSILGVLISCVGTGFGIFLGGMRFIFGSTWAVQGVFTLFAILFVFIGVQFIGMGLLGEYIGRIYHDVRARPRYFVKQVIGRIEGKDDYDENNCFGLPQHGLHRH
jgi:undecaprenyl-phosphate 4-deoxy-4-formamido-L-arabinose transferase